MLLKKSGAMQAPDCIMAKWTAGVRLSNSTNELIETDIKKALYAFGKHLGMKIKVEHK